MSPVLGLGSYARAVDELGVDVNPVRRGDEAQ